MAEVLYIPAVGQHRRAPDPEHQGNVIVITRVDYERQLAWAHRVCDGRAVDAGEGWPWARFEEWPLLNEVTIEMEYDDLPKGMNTAGSGYKTAHWAVGAREKKRWDSVDPRKPGILNQLLALERTRMGQAWPDGHVEYVYATAVATFPGASQADTGNWKSMLEKVVGDATVRAGLLPNDRARRFEMREFEMRYGGRGVRHLRLSLTWPSP